MEEIDMIHEAIDFLISEVDEPALSHPELDKSIKYKVINTKSRIKSFQKVGDLNFYLQRFSTEPTPEKALTYNALKLLNLKTYEDVYPIFSQKFKSEIEDTTVLSDFIIGKTYTSWSISNFARDYDNRKGIYLIRREGILIAIFIKVTLYDGRYPNKWLVKDKVLKYYLKNRANKFRLEYEDNTAIYNTRNSNVPIYVFIKEDTKCFLTGIFEYTSHTTEDDESMWFKLTKVDNYEINNPLTEQEYMEDLQKKIADSQNQNKINREKRLNVAPKQPTTIQVITTQFKRNPDVIVAVLERANGICEYCKHEAPFKRLKDNTPYLEVHHIVPLANEGEDTVENALALCPNCHRRAHYG
jgi:5-methylcytosine-specific restriction enzyme A